MKLFSLHAYSLSPGRTGGHVATPIGGRIQVTQELKHVLDQNAQAARFDRRTSVDFQVDPSTRTNQTRDAILKYAFGNGSEADTASLWLARRLSAAMDLRSKPCLLVLAAQQDGSKRRITVWTFPKDEAFRFRSSTKGASIQVLTDVFSQTSKLRKAALFEGRNLRTEFLSGRALDFQSNQISQDVANFWINSFLECQLSIGGDAGTRLLAKTVKLAAERCSDVRDQEQLAAAVMAIRNSPRTRWSLDDFANRYLQGAARDAFTSVIPNYESRVSSFDFQKGIFDDALKFRVFALDTGVWVSSPFGEVGRTVTLTGTTERRLSCEGTVVQQRVRARHA